MYYDLAERERFVNEMSDIVRTGRYALKVDSIHTSKGKNHFLTQRISMIYCENPGDFEKYAIKYKTNIYRDKEDITNEVFSLLETNQPLKIMHKNLIEVIKKYPPSLQGF